MVDQAEPKAVRGRSERWGIFALIALLAVGLGGFLFAVNNGISWRGEFVIVAAELSEPNVLSLSVETCNDGPEIGEFEESDEAVKVSVISTQTLGGPGSGDCLDIVRLELAEPLGDRPVIDLTSGEELTVGGR